MSTCCEFDFKRITHFGCPGPKPVAITEENLASKLVFENFRRQKSSTIQSTKTLHSISDIGKQIHCTRCLGDAWR